MRDFQKNTRLYPQGTLIAYGPTPFRATKFAAVIYEAPDAVPTAVERWHVQSGDIRNSAEIMTEVADFFKSYGTKDTLVNDRIMGCPHEEGIDYPLGGICPECPFWAENDRFTHEPKIPEETSKLSGHVEADEILLSLADFRGCSPKAALASADFRREEMVPKLLEYMEIVMSDLTSISVNDFRLFTHALYLFAKWREPRAFPSVLRWLSLPNDGAYLLVGDDVLFDGGRILASVSGGDRPEIRALVENREVHESCRAEALDALAILVLWGDLPRETFVTYLRELIASKLEREPNFIWGSLACLVIDFPFPEILPLLREPYDAGWVDNQIMDPHELEPTLPLEQSSSSSSFARENPRITDVTEETEWWPEYHLEAPDAPPTPRVAEAKPGRNDQCPCGSGKKYKKCCGKEA